MKNQHIGQWFDQNQSKLNEISDKEKAAALSTLRKYVKDNLKGRTQYGAHSTTVLGCEPEDYYIQKAWEKLYNGYWEWKKGRTLAGQLCGIASNLLQKQVKKYRNMC